ncbi:hypothetical protein WU68_05075 [Limosilactobacillus fermentum]|nr:hypothetical protein [Limosilactobacillus fermentum]KLD55034.1 hypothetical protein WU68_05075 [Limosilactobacillus fermentum]
MHEIWNWFKGLFSGGKIQSNIGKANTSNSIDGNNNFSSGNIEVGNGSVVGNNNSLITYKVTVNRDDSDRIRLIKKFSNDFLYKADKIHREIGLSSGKNNVPDFCSELAVLENSIDTTVDIPKELVSPAREIVQSLWSYYKVVANFKNSDSGRYAVNFESSKQEVVNLSRNYSDILRNYIHAE